MEKGGCASVVVDYVRVSREGRGLALSRIDLEMVKGLKKGSLVVPICEDSF